MLCRRMRGAEDRALGMTTGGALRQWHLVTAAKDRKPRNHLWKIRSGTRHVKCPPSRPRWMNSLPHWRPIRSPVNHKSVEDVAALAAAQVRDHAHLCSEAGRPLHSATAATNPESSGTRLSALLSTRSASFSLSLIGLPRSDG